MSDYTLHNPWHYRCPFCGADNGTSCRTTSGQARTSHEARLVLAAHAKARTLADDVAAGLHDQPHP